MNVGTPFNTEITLSASNAGHARQKFQKCEIIFIFSTHSSRVDVRSLSDLFRPVTSSTYYYDASEAAAAAVTVGRC